MIPTNLIERKRDGLAVDPPDLVAFLLAYLRDEIPDYQMSALLMAVYFRGLNEGETEAFVRTMLESGTSLELSHLPGPRVDKHSTGGVGDKVSLALAPLAASLGIFVPMMSGRGLGHTSGTLDKLDAIPGFQTQMDLAGFERVLARVGCAMIGQTREIAPLDRRVYALRDVTGTVPILPLIAASIMSKKLAEGLTGLVLDVKVGDGAFLPEEDRALELARKMVDIGTGRGLPTVALLTAMDRPLGLAIGNGLETAEAIDCLKGGGPSDLRALVIAEVAAMLCVAGLATERDEAERRAAQALDSGAALERFERMVVEQGGDPSVIAHPERLKTASEQRGVQAETSGIVNVVRPRSLGEGVVRLGGGRLRMDQAIDLGVGFEVIVRPGDRVEKGDPIGVVHTSTPSDADLGADILRGAVVVVASNALEAPDHGPMGRPLVSHVVDEQGTRAY